MIVRRLLAKLESRAGAGASARKSSKAEIEKALCEYLDDIPPTTDLVFVEENFPSANSAVLKAIQSAGGKVVQSKSFNDEELADWIEKRVRLRHGKISRVAARELASFVGDNLQALDTEIEKLTIYADSREITDRDVHEMVSYAREASVFTLVDAVGKRDRRTALRRLRELLKEGDAPAYLTTMITRQIRLILLVKELSESGRSPDQIGSELRLHRFQRDKLLQQSRQFSLRQLEQAYHRILATDVDVKTGKADAVVALDLLVAELAQA